MNDIRKHQLNQIKDILKTLYDATAEMKSFFARGERVTVVQLLADSQELAVQIGEFIEQLQGEGTKTVEQLTTYCEALYHASLEVTGSGANGDFVKCLRRHLLAIGNCADTELKQDKLEIAFFPYNASMWDSLESIWLAAKDDPRVDAYVVPIPYYDRLPNGEPGQMHYEGDEYPDYVPIVDWRKYDVEAIRPDAIFIHNAYDDINLITTVHPDFYSKRLRQFTDQLVYVPYFVCATDFVPDHFCSLPGILYAHKVIAQTENVRKIYIREYKKLETTLAVAAGKFGRAEDKFLALGSPKFDKVINAKPEDFTLPEEWRSLIEKPDGTRKKTILYNTSISAILEYKEQYLLKLRRVFETFEKSEDAVLWWRPHPLSVSTYQSMRPKLREEYEQIVAEYKRRGFGIYDDTPDLHRALCLTSIFYGDNSSLGALFGVTGKPMIIQDPVKADSRRLLRFNHVAVDENENAWAWDRCYNGLFKLNFQADSAKLIARNDDLPGVSESAYNLLDSSDGVVTAFPSLTNEIFIYNVNSSKARSIKLDPSFRIGSQGFGIFRAVKYNDSYYCFGHYLNAVLVYETRTQTVRYDTKLFDLEKLRRADGRSVKVPMLLSPPDEAGTVTLLFREHGSLLKYNLITQKVEIVASDPIIAACFDAVFDGAFYWIINKTCSKLIQLAATGNIVQYRGFPKGFASPDAARSGMRLADCNDYLLLFPGYENMILRFDKRTGEFSEYTKMPVPNDLEHKLFKYTYPMRVGRKVYAFYMWGDAVFELNLDSGDVIEHQFQANMDDYRSMLHAALNGSVFGEAQNGEPFVIHESKHIGNIEGLLPDVPTVIPGQKEQFLRLTTRPQGNSGKEIMKMVRTYLR